MKKKLNLGLSKELLTTVSKYIIMMKGNNNVNIVEVFIEHLDRLQYKMNMDPYWELIFSNGKTKWFYLNISVYNGVYYIAQLIGESENIEIHNKSEIKQGQSFGFSHSFFNEKNWYKIFELAIAYIKKVIKNPLKEYLILNQKFPFKYRQGILQKSLLWQFDSELYRYDKQITPKQLYEFCALVEKKIFSSHGTNEFKNMTANKFFEMCKIAYLNCGFKLTATQKKLTGRKMYEQFADGRHEGLLDINPNSEEEFMDWLAGTHPKYSGGGHPWEILRGGNSTHISLHVTQNRLGDRKSTNISLAGHSSVRLAETIKIALALYNNGYTVDLNDVDLIRQRLLGQDYLGVVPEYASLHRASQLFEKKIEDVLHLADINSKSKVLINLISWQALPFNHAIK